MAQHAHTILVEAGDPRQIFTRPAPTGTGREATYRVAQIHVYDDGSTWVWAEQMTKSGRAYKSGMGLSMGSGDKLAELYGVEVASVVTEALVADLEQTPKVEEGTDDDDHWVTDEMGRDVDTRTVASVPTRRVDGTVMIDGERRAAKREHGFTYFRGPGLSSGWTIISSEEFAATFEPLDSKLSLTPADLTVIDSAMELAAAAADHNSPSVSLRAYAAVQTMIDFSKISDEAKYLARSGAHDTYKARQTHDANWD